MPTPRQALRAFADTAQNPELAQLENLLKRFNLFEAVGIVRHELRHSDFLAFLLDPSQNHGLGASFLSGFLQAVCQDVDGDAFLVDFNNLSKATVQREWHHVDILAVDDASRFGLVIENKIGTGEHSDQLNRYRAAFDSHYPGYKVLALYLTPDGDVPSSADYQAVSYALVCDVIEKLAQDNRGDLGSEIVMVLEHYAQMLRRHILSDSDIAILCRSIYQRHKQALDLIFEHRPDQQAQIKHYVSALIEQTEGLCLGTVAKSWVTFGLEEWKASSQYENGALRYLSGPSFIYFEFHNMPSDLRLLCTVSPGDSAERNKLFEMAQRNHFVGSPKKLNKGHYRPSIFQVLTPNDYEQAQEEIEALISEKWTAYLRDELPRMAKAIRDEKWLWELPQNTL